MRHLVQGEQRLVQVCREHGLAASLVQRWHTEDATRGEAAITAAHPADAERLARRIAELEQVCGLLAVDKAVLKQGLQNGPWRSGTR